MTLKTLADVRKLISHIPKERRALPSWQHVETTLEACAAGGNTLNISVALIELIKIELPAFAAFHQRRVQMTCA